MSEPSQYESFGHFVAKRSRQVPPWLSDETWAPPEKENYEDIPRPKRRSRKPTSVDIRTVLRRAQEVRQKLIDLQEMVENKKETLQKLEVDKTTAKDRVVNLTRLMTNMTKENVNLRTQVQKVFHDLNVNLDLGSPNAFKLAKLLVEKEKLLQQLESVKNSTVSEVDNEKLKQAMEENSRLHEQVDGNMWLIENAPKMAAENEQLRASIGDVNHIIQENIKLKDENRRLILEKEQLDSGSKQATHTVSNLVKRILPLSVTEISSQARTSSENEIHMSSSECEPKLQAANTEIEKEKNINQGLQDRMMKIQNSMSEKDLHNVINDYLVRRRQLVEKTGELQSTEAEIAQELEKMMSIETSATKGSQGATNLLAETQHVHGVMSELYTGMQRLQEDQQMAMKPF